jgi:GTP-binding protein
VDIRHKPTELDRQMYEWIMEAGFNGIIVATKADKLSKSQQNKQIEIIKRTLKAEDGLVIPVSSANRTNKYEIWELINEIFKVNNFDILMERQNDSQ